jgi:nucleoside 2-deoxyribosyltransferase
LNKINRLWGNSCYLSGVIDRVTDKEAKDWRLGITPFLNELGIIVLDPCHKALQTPIEDERKIFTKLSQEKKWGEFKEFGREVRRIDLRMVDKCDFVIAKIDMMVYNCGTIEEITWANMQRKPVILWCPEGIQKLAGWFKLMLPMDLLFGDLDDVKIYLNNMNSAPDSLIDDLGRWRFFDYRKLYGQIMPLRKEEK